MLIDGDQWGIEDNLLNNVLFKILKKQTQNTSNQNLNKNKHLKSAKTISADKKTKIESMGMLQVLPK